LRQCRCHSAGIIISTTNIMLRDHGWAAFRGSGESNNFISSTTAMGTVILRWSIFSGIGFSAPIAVSSPEDVL